MDKKIKELREALPRLDESEARRLLTASGGSVNKAVNLSLEEGEWSAAAAKKKPVAKKSEEKKVEAAPRREDRPPRREFVERKPRAAEEVKVESKPIVKSTPATIVVGASKSKVEAGLSFADMIKRQKQQAEAAVEPTPEPVVEAAPVKEEPAAATVEVVVEVPVAVEEPVAAPAAPAVEAAPKPKKERKEPKKPKAAPLPQKYEAEIDRVAAVNLPANIEALASGAFTFSSEPGRAPSPPRPAVQQPVQQHHQQNDWGHQQQVRQQPGRWNQQQDGNYQQRHQHFANDWRQNRYDNNNNMGYQNNRMPAQQYRQDNYNNNVGAMRSAQPQQPQNFW